MSKQKQKNNFCTQHVENLYFSGNSMNNLLSYCGLTDARMRASEKDLPVHCTTLCDKYKRRHLSMSHKSLEKIRDFEGKILGCRRSHKACQSNLAVVRKVSLSSNC